jgi:hypothetical protein
VTKYANTAARNAAVAAAARDFLRAAQAANAARFARRAFQCEIVEDLDTTTGSHGVAPCYADADAGPETWCEPCRRRQECVDELAAARNRRRAAFARMRRAAGADDDPQPDDHDEHDGALASTRHDTGDSP